MDESSTYPGNSEMTDEMENMYLTFNVGNEVYGVEIRYVIQIIGMQEITEMPDMPSTMKGFINLRGRVVPVASMRLRFGKEEVDYNERTCIVVVNMGERDTGLIVDAIQETITIEPDQVSPPPTTGDNLGSSFVSGVAQLPNGRTAILVDVQSLFSGINY